jgi:hypothetical protein
MTIQTLIVTAIACLGAIPKDDMPTCIAPARNLNDNKTLLSGYCPITTASHH